MQKKRSTCLQFACPPVRLLTLEPPLYLKATNACIDEGWYIVLSTLDFQVEVGFMRINQDTLVLQV